ncbi:MAG: hypothetical protein J6J31_00775 [Thermoguttaceae bacterium]|nr:hypothetical protein [Thermoguttaceae bacterium]
MKRAISVIPCLFPVFNRHDRHGAALENGIFKIAVDKLNIIKTGMFKFKIGKIKVAKNILMKNDFLESFHLEITSLDPLFLCEIYRSIKNPGIFQIAVFVAAETCHFDRRSFEIAVGHNIIRIKREDVSMTKILIGDWKITIRVALIYIGITSEFLCRQKLCADKHHHKKYKKSRHWAPPSSIDAIVYSTPLPQWA